MLTLFYFQLWAAFSGTSLYDSLVQAGFNFFLGWPAVGVGVFNRDVSAAFAMAHPELYASGRMDLNLNGTKMRQRVLQALLHSIAIFGLPAAAAQFGIWGDHDGFTGTGVWIFGTSVYSCLICVMQYKIAFETATWTWVTHLFLWGSFLFYFVFLCIYTNMIGLEPQFYWVAFDMLSLL